MSLEQRRGLRLKSFLRNGTAADSSGRDAVRDVATATGSVTFKSTEPGKADGGTAPTPTARRVDSFSRLRRTPSELRRAEGFWSYLDDSALDRLDVCLSRKFFFLSFGLGEYLLAAPGTIFGFPVVAMSSMSLLLPYLSEHIDDHHEGAYLCAWVGLAIAALYCGLSLVGCLREKERWGEKVVRQVFKRDFYLFAISFPLVMGWLAGGNEILAPISFHTTCYNVSQCFIALVKCCSGRVRPCAKTNLRAELQKLGVQRVVKLHAIFEGPRQSHMSFPSGDACGAAVFSACVFLASGRTAHTAWIWVILACLGRMYFWLHHLGDVGGGSFVGIWTCFLLDSVAGVHAFGFVSAGVSTAATLYLFVNIDRLRHFARRKLHLATE
mmetsp:Transcript_3597/g.12904  ORF Transcript_3597/g.12904 Transcript_3597/m.12904 type:complete len:382 (-) Transcript_3597:777-1922(-)